MKKKPVPCQDCLHAQVEIQTLKHELEKALKELSEVRGTDPMTGLANKKRMYEEIDHHLEIIKRKIAKGSDKEPEHFSIIFIDLDEFKALNDGNHVRGDRLLTEFANFLRALTRAGDMPARFGGDEFAIFATNTNKEQAEKLCEKILKKLISYQFDTKHEPARIKASLGAASTSEGFLGLLLLVEKADARMQVQKNEGKQKK